MIAAAKTDLLAAVKMALQKFPDGKAFRAATEEEEGKAIFEVHVLVGDKIKEVEVDAVVLPDPSHLRSRVPTLWRSMRNWPHAFANASPSALA